MPNGVDELSHPWSDDAEDEVDELSHPVDDDAEDEVDELPRPVDVTQGRADELSEPVDDVDLVDEPFHPLDVAENDVDDDAEVEVDELPHPVDDAENRGDELSRQVDDDGKDQEDELSHPVDVTQGQANELTHPVDEIQSQVDELATSEEGALDSKDFHTDEVTTEKVFNRLSHSTMAGVDGELVGLDDSTENRDVLIQSVDGHAFKNREDELISEGNDFDSEFFRLDKLSSSKGIEDLRHLNMTNTKNPFENPRNNADILPLDEQNGNESHFGKFPDEHLEKVQSVSDSDLMEFVEKSFDEAPITAEDLDRRKIDIDEFQGSGDMGDSFDALTDTKIESKSGRIIDFFPRVNNTAECTTPKGERGRCRSLSQCPLSDPLNNFNIFLQYVCLSRGVLVGICCPDNPVVEISDPTENSTGTPVKEFKHPIDGCGLNTNTRIVGGKVSLPHEWTWMVALLRRNRFFCGGVIINDWYILTAAHCVMGVKVKDLKVRLGEYNFNEKKDHQEDIPVTEIKRHALFVTLTFQHDIALLKLKRRIEYTKFIGSICLPNPKSGNFSNANATVVGWGTEAFGGTASPVLRQVTVPVWDNEECDKTYRLERITNAFLCAGSPENGEDACQGDSGGPLMTLNEEGRWEVIGVVSWGRRCGDPTFPGVYTRVTSYLDWIAENAN
ncbi:Proclotting enzyme [Araneus ventricosus]|uniref:Proclotting enzyme n=1 Tax=Araneus ventricosus TaxID=182803 RepID=A0A4Y1ZZ00_ARAVE|nr:Proclotting enzyme [Araneus ventricosus]